MFSSKSNEWTTPKDLFDKLNSEFNFTLDVASTHDNALCENHYTVDENGLQQKWGGNVFCNPPYGREIGLWVEKGYKESLRNSNIVVMLIPARTDTRYWHDYIFGKAEVRFIKGRLKFGESKNSAPFPSAIVIFRGDNSEKVKEVTGVAY